MAESKHPRKDFSPLKAHRRHGQMLTPPLMQLSGVQLTSWHNTRLPEVMWAALLTSALPREEYMRHLSFIAKAAMEFSEQSKGVSGAHQNLRDFTADFPNIIRRPLVRRKCSFGVVAASALRWPARP
jgi:hypothetical protein